MNVDGEWRTAFIADEAPKLNYGTAPVPVDDDNADLYGGGYTTGNIAGIPKRAEHPEHAWALLKYLATDDKAMAQLSNGLRNVPTTESSAKSPDLKPDPKFETFLKIYGSPNTTTTPVTAAGSANQELFNSFTNKWQAGRVSDLEARPDRHRQADRRAARERRGQAGAVSEDRRRARNRAQWRRRLTVLAFMSPWLVGFTVFFGYPLIATVYLSFTHYDLLQPSRWIGLANYRYLLNGDKQIWPAVSNTLWLVVIAVPLKVMFAFGVALMLTRARRGIGFFRTVFYLPALAPPVAATLGFVYLLNPSTGPVNQVLGVVGIDGPLWFNDPGWSKPALTLLLMWGVGNLMIIFLAALVDVPRHLYESAQLDGAGAWQRLRWVTLPSISPVLLFAVVIGTIEALQIFDQAYVGATIAAGSASSAGDPSNDLGYPEDSTLFYPVLLFQQGFRFFNMGYAAAMAVLLLIVSLAITLAIVRNSRRWVHYAGAGR